MSITSLGRWVRGQADLKLTLDGGWQPEHHFRPTHAKGPVPSGQRPGTQRQPEHSGCRASSLACRAMLPPNSTACNCSSQGHLSSKAGRAWRRPTPHFLPQDLCAPGCPRPGAGVHPTPSLPTTRPLRNNHLHRREPGSITKPISVGILMAQAREEVLFIDSSGSSTQWLSAPAQVPKAPQPLQSEGGWFFHNTRYP